MKNTACSTTSALTIPTSLLSLPFHALSASILMAIGLVVPAYADDVTIDHDRQVTVNLPTGGGTVTIADGVHIATTQGHGVEGGWNDTWHLINAGDIHAALYGVVLRPAAGADAVVDNHGAIFGALAGLQSTGSLTLDNAAGASIDAGRNTALLTAQLLTLHNAGNIGGQADVAISASYGVCADNSGSISGKQIGLAISNVTLSGQQFDNRIVNRAGGVIEGGNEGISLRTDGWTDIVNAKEARLHGGKHALYSPYFDARIALDNAGEVSADQGAAIYASDTVHIVNRSTGSIIGQGGLAFVRQRDVAVENDGLIRGSGSSMVTGVAAAAGSGAGIYLARSGSVSIRNGASGTIEGTVYGIYQDRPLRGSPGANTSIVNQGTIRGSTAIASNLGGMDIVNRGLIDGTGGVAIAFDPTSDNSNSLTLGDASVIRGQVIGGAGNNTLTLVENGEERLDRFEQFQQLVMQGATWTLDGHGGFGKGTDVQAGMLRVDGTLVTPTTQVQADAVLAGRGRIVGDVINRGVVAPGTGVIGSTAFGNLLIQGRYQGEGGVVRLNTVLNDGGALAAQATDRLLIHGDVHGQTVLDVHAQDSGAAMQPALAHGAAQGISLVQVSGQSTPDAFVLPHGYVAMGPWRYTLQAYGPGETRADQSLLGADPLDWDYRLDRADAGCQAGCDPDPVAPPVPVVPQVPGYISAPTALLAYGEQLDAGLHQRLGEIRQVPRQEDGTHGGEVFARYVGGDFRYFSNRTTAAYGYAYDQQMHALQLGANLLTWAFDGATLRAGIGFDVGDTTITPRDADGASRTRYHANGVTGWVTWQSRGGFYVDAVVGGRRYSGDISTGARGGVAGLRASDWTASVEAGYPFALSPAWSLEPQVQLARQSLRFDAIHDADGLTTQFRHATQTSARIGARLTKLDDLRFMPYLRLDAIGRYGGSAEVLVDGVPFTGGRNGDGYRAGLGATSQLTPWLGIYGEADYQHGFGGYGLSGWSVNLGLRVGF